MKKIIISLILIIIASCNCFSMERTHEKNNTINEIVVYPILEASIPVESFHNDSAKVLFNEFKNIILEYLKVYKSSIVVIYKTPLPEKSKTNNYRAEIKLYHKMLKKFAKDKKNNIIIKEPK